MTTSAKSIDASRPNYIVVFKRASENNTRTLSALLKKGAARGAKSRAANVQLLAGGETGVLTRVYESIGVAVTDMTDQQAATLKKRDDVAAVAVNQLRFLPPRGAVRTPVKAWRDPVQRHKSNPPRPTL